jgi:hypothetical protein
VKDSLLLGVVESLSAPPLVQYQSTLVAGFVAQISSEAAHSQVSACYIGQKNTSSEQVLSLPPPFLGMSWCRES